MVDLFPPCRAGDVMLRLCNLSLNGRQVRWDAMVKELSDVAGPLTAQAALEIALPAGQEADLDSSARRAATHARAKGVLAGLVADGSACLN
jgi:hypothetical protein